MSIACQKQYSLTVQAAAPTVDAYWTMQESGVNTNRVDKVNSVALVRFGVNPVMDAQPGLFGNGLAYPEKSAICGFDTGRVAPLAFQTTVGWSIFGWFKVLHWADNPPFNTGWSFPPTLNLGYFGVNIYMSWDPLGAPYFGPAGAPNTVTFSCSDDNSNTFTPANFSPVVGQWYFFHFFFDGSRLGYSINNGAEVVDPNATAAFASGFPGEFQLFQGWANPDTATISVIVDEIGLKLSRKLTHDEITYLYNGGAGRTWPL